MSELTTETILLNGVKRDVWIQKGGKAVVGEIRKFGNRKKQKQADGTWKEVRDSDIKKPKLKGKFSEGQKVKIKAVDGIFDAVVVKNKKEGSTQMFDVSFSGKKKKDMTYISVKGTTMWHPTKDVKAV